LRVLDLFSGIGGFSLGLHRTGMTTVAFCEIEPFPQAVLRKNFPGVPIYDDVRTLTAARLAADGITGIDIVCGGFPCQPWSDAGEQRGEEDHRHLWPEMLRVIKEVRPTWVIGENVAGFARLALEDSCADLEAAGYEVQPFIIPACAVDAEHRRDRCWIVAHSDRVRQLQCQGCERQERGRAGNGSEPNDVADSHGKQHKVRAHEIEGQIVQELSAYSPGIPWRHGDHDDVETVWYGAQGGEAGSSIRPYQCWPPEPPLGRVAYGVSGGVDQLKGLGNAVVPQIPEIIGRAIVAIERAR
jgi:DNA (cytosine-5)-methyltransferase 1